MLNNPLILTRNLYLRIPNTLLIIQWDYICLFYVGFSSIFFSQVLYKLKKLLSFSLSTVSATYLSWQQVAWYDSSPRIFDFTGILNLIKFQFQIIQSMSKLVCSIVLVLFLTSHVYAVKVQCQNQPSSWKAGQKFQLSPREVLVPTIYEGVDLFVDGLDGFVSRIIINSGYWEPKNLRNMARFVEAGYTILNVGTHVGIQAVVLGKALGSNGRLFMFEPFSVSHNLALKNVYFNGLADITTSYNVGGGSAYSKGVEFIDMGNTGGSRVFTNQANVGDPSKNEEVVVDKIDDVLPSDVVLDFVLIDVERMELDVINGMKNLILKSPNIIIFCEWSGNYFRTSGETQKMIDVVAWFVEHKFRFFQMTGGEAACQYAPWAQRTGQQIMDVTNYPDILFVPSHIDPNRVGL